MAEPVVERAWGPQACARCTGPLPRGLVLLERDAHVDCDEARAAYAALSAAGKAPELRR